MKIRLTNPSGMLKEFDWGFSWKVFFFGGFVPLFRGDIKGFLIATFLVFATFGLYWPYFAFVYNKKYVASFLEKGFYPADEASRSTLSASGLIMGIIPTNPPPINLGNGAPQPTNEKQAEIASIQQPEGKDTLHLRYRDVFSEKCPGCGTPRTEGFSFCGTCGSKLEVLKRQATCVACGNDVDDDTEKCPSCGQLLVEQPSPTEQWACMACGMQNMAGNSFCGKCGTRRGADAGQATQVPMPNSIGNRSEPSNIQPVQSLPVTEPMKLGNEKIASFLLIAGVLCAIAVFYFAAQQRESQSLSVIVNTLRNYKSATLMYYTDNDEWPSGTNLQNILDTYTDRHLDTKYFTTVQTVSVGNGRVLIGLVGATGSPLTQANIQAKLESQAGPSALYAADGTPYVAGTAAVYTNIH